MREEIEKYLQKATDCLSDAEYLLKDNRLEASCNRAYYAIFHAIQALLVNQNISAKSHQGLHTKFRELFIKTSVFSLHFSEILAESFSLRQGGDYENDFEIVQTDAERILNEAQMFVETAVKYLGSFPF